MMLSKSDNDKAAEEAPQLPAPLNTASAANSVADLERRLREMETKPAAAAVAPVVVRPPAAAKPPAAAGGAKNALLARIMAAQERAKQTPAAPPEAPPVMAAPPAVAPSSSFDFMTPGAGSAPPPVFDPHSLPPAMDSGLQAPPPTFDVHSLPPPTTQAPSFGNESSLMWDPNTPAPPPTMDAAPLMAPPVSSFVAPSAPSAPSFDLLGFGDTSMAPPAMEAPPVPVPPPEESQGGLDEETLQAILGMEGLSMEEKQAMIAEQERILQEFEDKKKSSQTTAADAFVQRSHAAAVQAIGGRSSSSAAQSTSAAGGRTVDIGNGQEVALRGADQTNKAIEDGTAVVAQCLSCENWMQVTGNATLMFCPVCQTVSPVLKDGDDAAAAQMKADMELAQRLQNEEYNTAEQVRRPAKKATTPTAAANASGSWMDWLGLGSTAATGVAVATPERPSFAQKPVARGDIGVSRPPGAGGGGLQPAQTGTESLQFSPSYEEDGPLLGGGGAAVVAQRQPLFACVADSITSAATSLSHALNQDEEGNVHGVDSGGLLAVTQAGRESTQYQQLDDGRTNF